MKRLILMTGAVFMFLTAAAQEEGFTLKGELEGIINKEVYLLLRTETGTDTVARAAVNDHRFELKGRLEEPALCLLYTGPNQGVRLFMENADMTVSGNLPDIDVTGSKSHDELEKMTIPPPEVIEIQQKLAGLSQSYREASAAGDTTRAAELMTQATPLVEQLEVARNDHKEWLTNYIRTQPATFATPYIILSTFYRPDPNAFLPAFEKFPQAVKNSTLGKALKSKLDELAPTAVGKKAPEIAGKTPDGGDLSLSEMKGKVTLIDFWASWCGPCRKENPNVVKLYEKYHPKGFNILGVSLDDNVASWKQAIAEDGLTWSHVSDLKKWDSALTRPYAVNAIPYTVLIDENGIIIASNLRGKALEEKLAELLGK